MLVFGAASQPWETLSPLQPANAGAAAGGAGIDQFVTETSLPTAAAAGSAPSVPPPSGLIGQGPLSSNVLGFLIWNQSQQSAATPWAPGGSNQAVTDGASNVPASPTGGQTDTS